MLCIQQGPGGRPSKCCSEGTGLQGHTPDLRLRCTTPSSEGPGKAALGPELGCTKCALRASRSYNEFLFYRGRLDLVITSGRAIHCAALLHRAFGYWPEFVWVWCAYDVRVRSPFSTSSVSLYRTLCCFHRNHRPCADSSVARRGAQRFVCKPFQCQ